MISRCLRPRHVVSAPGPRPRFGHPNSAVLTAFHRRGDTVLPDLAASPAFRGLIDEVLRDAERVGVRRGRTEDGAARLLVLHDESANIAPIPELARRASTARGYGITLVSIFQGFPQIESAYGRDAGTVFAQHAARLLLPGASDVDTLRAFSGPEGDGQVTTSSSTSSIDGRASSTEGQQWRPTLEVRELRRMPRWTGLLLYGNLPAVRVRLRPPVGVTV